LFSEVNRMYFPSKKDGWLFILNAVVVIACFAPLLTKSDYFALLFTIPLAVFLIWSWFTTGYEVKDGELIIRCGPFKTKIDIQKIRSIRPTKNPLSAFALSIDRLEITYDPNYGMALVSPKKKETFVKLLKEQNPAIREVK
jgi:hypothetical protein